jgi:hypothetical protein
MDKTEPPLPEHCKSPLFMVGKDKRGHWVAQSQSGLCGGIFVNRAEALKFAMFESGNPRAVIMVPGAFELDMGAKLPAGQQHAPARAPVYRAA